MGCKSITIWILATALVVSGLTGVIAWEIVNPITMLHRGLVFGMGFVWAMIPAILKIRFGTNEILVSLMLVYVAQLFLDWLVRGPWRNPEGFNFPETRLFADAALLLVAGALFMLIGSIGARDSCDSIAGPGLKQSLCNPLT